jgi:hypothetical protein
VKIGERWYDLARPQIQIGSSAFALAAAEALLTISSRRAGFGRLGAAGSRHFMRRYTLVFSTLAFTICASTAFAQTFSVIRANGGVPGGVGTGYAGGGGSGGAIELVAPSISDAASGDSTCAPGGTHHGNIWAGANKNAINGNPGTIRLEATALNVDTRCVGAGGGDPAVSANVFTSPNLVFTLVPLSQIWVTSVGGYAIGQGAFAYPLAFPDQVVSFSSPVTVNVAATYIPVGTVPVIFVTSINTGNTQAFTCSPLSGNVAPSTCSASVTFPSGGSYGYVKATWGQ